MSEDNPGHRYRPEPVHGADGVSAHVTVADDLQVGANGKRKQKFLEDTCKSNRKRQGKVIALLIIKRNFIYIMKIMHTSNFLNQRLIIYIFYIIFYFYIIFIFLYFNY